MSVRIPLKNRENRFVIIDEQVEQEILSNGYLMSIRLLEHLREHSRGYAVYQRCISTKKGPTFETIYLHRYVAEKFCKRPATKAKLMVRFINGDVLDCRISNLEWVTMSTLRRHMPPSSTSSGYRGVTEENGRFRAILHHKRKPINLGLFETAEQAAAAYNAKSLELFGPTPSLNVLPAQD
jgi:hypothetical protein